jgi:zinc transport system substrate-binding protein
VPTSSPRRRPLLALPLAAALGLTACASPAADEQAAGPTGSPEATATPLVVANFYPVQWLVESIGATAVTTQNLTPEGVEPHDLALTGPSRQALEEATAVFYLGSAFQPDVEKAVAQLPGSVTSVDLLDLPAIELLPAPADLGKESLTGGKDPHVWLDPQRMAVMAVAVGETLREVVPADAEAIQQRTDEVVASLEALDEALATDLSGCAQDTIVTSHAAFQYLADRYGKRQIAIAGISPEDEPDPATLDAITEVARDAGVTTVFFEEALPADLSQTVAAEIGADIALLAALEFDPRLSIGPDADYLSVMADNGVSLRGGLQCG